MRHPRSLFVFCLLLSLSLSLFGCTEEGVGTGETLSIADDEVTKADPWKADSSAVAVFLDFEFDGEAYTSSTWQIEKQIEDQMLYTMGQLNGERAVGRLDKLVLSDVQTERVGDLTHVTYHATLLVAWGSKTDVPAEYTLKLPRDISYAGKQAFTEKYSHDCVDYGAHDVTTGSMWYYFRPQNSRCDLAAEDIFELPAKVSVSDVNTSGKYPEYHKVWSDGVLNVVAVFGKYEDGATSNSDAGISAYNNFSTLLSDELEGHDLKTTPELIPSAPGAALPELQFEAQLDDGHRVVVTALLVDNVRTAGREFEDRYEALSTDADLIFYNGHAGLGANIKALAEKGAWVEGQYAIVFMNGCDTYAYVDSSLFDAHAEVNSDDEEGTKYLDIVTNAMPSFFRSMPRATIAMVKGLMSYDEPKTYEQIFNEVDTAQIVLVSGEHDNEYVPGFGDTPDERPDEAWSGLDASGTLARNEVARYASPKVPAGTYVFELNGTADADLYVRVGLEPSERAYDCRPYKSGSRETCSVELSSPAVIHVMVSGWASSSDFTLSSATK